MDVAGHPEASGPGKNFHSFFLLAIAQTTEYYVLIFVPYKNIQPLHNGEANEMNTIGVIKLVVAAHVRLQLRLSPKKKEYNLVDHAIQSR